MADWKIVRAETVTCNDKQAREAAGKHMNLPHSPTERDIDPKRVERLKAVIEEGRAIPFNWAVGKFQGKEFRMNGQHSSKAICEYEGDLPVGIVIHLDHYEMMSRAGVAELFRQFDSRWSARSKLDISGAYQGLCEDLQSCNRKKVKMAVEGIGWYERNIVRLPVPSDDALYTKIHVDTYHPFILWIDELLSSKTKEMEKSAVLGGIYATWTKSETGAKEFWHAVALNNLPDDSAPASVLSRELQEAKEEKKQLAPAEYYAKCIKAWNAFRVNEKIRGLNVNTKKGLPEIAA